THPSRQGTLVEVCSRCHGVWLDGGQIYELSSRPKALQQQLEQGLRDRRASSRQCPRCHVALDEGTVPGQDTRADTCSSCGGICFDAGEVQRVLRGAGDLQLDVLDDVPAVEADPHKRAQAQERLQSIATGLLALPNLF